MKRLINHIIFHLISWLIVYNVLTIFVYLIRRDQPEAISYITGGLFWASVAAFVIAILLGISDFYFNRMERNFESFKKVILAKSALYVLVISLTIFIANLVGFLIEGEMDLWAFMKSPAFATIFLFSIIICFFLNFIQQVNKKFGQGELWAVILGKYFKPRAEKRIFMFLDLRSSTRYAEVLGHIKYSELIQRCFHYINLVVPQYKARLYQYVGDEAVLTWSWEEGLYKNRCIGLYFALADLIRHKADRLKEEFGLIPEFKAGVHGGDITVAEVGDIKREIAYHGDVINTAARIQGKCNDFRRELLVSKIIHDHLHGYNWKSEKMGEVQLKGKQEPVIVYAITNQGE